jgi:hypothetical protein
MILGGLGGSGGTAGPFDGAGWNAVASTPFVLVPTPTSGGFDNGSPGFRWGQVPLIYGGCGGRALNSGGGAGGIGGACASYAPGAGGGGGGGSVPGLAPGGAGGPGLVMMISW